MISYLLLSTIRRSTYKYTSSNHYLLSTNFIFHLLQQCTWNLSTWHQPYGPCKSAPWQAGPQLWLYRLGGGARLDTVGMGQTNKNFASYNVACATWPSWRGWPLCVMLWTVQSFQYVYSELVFLTYVISNPCLFSEILGFEQSYSKKGFHFWRK
jgi:hypothetical protein